MGTAISWLLLIMPPILAGIRLVFVAKYLRNAKDNTFTDLAKMASLFVGIAILVWIGQIHTSLYGASWEGGWGFIFFAIPGLLVTVVFLELMVAGSKASKQNDNDT